MIRYILRLSKIVLLFTCYCVMFPIANIPVIYDRINGTKTSWFGLKEMGIII